MAVTDRLARLTAVGQAYLSTGELLATWSARLDGWQDQAAVLLAKAEQAEEVRLAEEARRDPLAAAVRRAHTTVQQAAADPVALPGAQQELARAERTLQACQDRIAEQEQRLAQLRDAAEELRTEVRMAGVRQAGAMTALVATPGDGQPFAIVAAAIAVELALGVVVDADGDGTVSAAELQAVLATLDPTSHVGTTAVATLLHALADHPAHAEALLADLGQDGVEALLHLLGEVPTGDHVAAWTDVLEATTALLAAGAAAGPDAADVIRQVLGRAVMTDDPVVLSVLAQVEGLPPDLGREVAELIHAHLGLDGGVRWPADVVHGLFPEVADTRLIALQAIVTNLTTLDLVAADGAPTELGTTVLSGALGLAALPHLSDRTGRLVTSLVGGLMDGEDGAALPPSRVIAAIVGQEQGLAFPTVGLVELLAPGLVAGSPDTRAHTRLWDRLLRAQPTEVVAVAADIVLNAVRGRLEELEGVRFTVDANESGALVLGAGARTVATLEALGPVLNAIVGRATLDAIDAAEARATVLADLSEVIGAAGTVGGTAGASPGMVAGSAVISALLGIAANHVRPGAPDPSAMAVADLDPALAQDIVAGLTGTDPQAHPDLLVQVERILDDMVVEATSSGSSLLEPT